MVGNQKEVEAIKSPVFKILIPSKSVKGDWHTVFFYKNGKIKCNCVGHGVYKANCWHIKRAKQLMIDCKKP